MLCYSLEQAHRLSENFCGHLDKLHLEADTVIGHLEADTVVGHVEADTIVDGRYTHGQFIQGIDIISIDR